jgi:glycerol-3-phosphate acyltransferase PlsY
MLPSVRVEPTTLLRDAILVGGAYLVGSVPMGVLMARATGGPDPRTIGSGRIGGTNVLRALGRGPALIVVLGDLAKGAVPVLLAVWATAGDATVMALCGLAAVIGAWHSVFLRFHGGRGVATGVGTMLVIEPWAIVLASPVFFGAVLASRYVSLGSLLGSAALIPAMLILEVVSGGQLPPVYIGYTIVGVAIIWLAHADNIERLRAGTERKIDFGAFTGRSSSGE